MHYNPCGRAVDMARRAYTTTARPFRDSDQVVKIRWYPARPEDGTLPFPSRICSLDWHSRPWECEGVGEVWNTPRNYNAKKKLVGPKADHVCGTEDDFRNGETLDASKPQTKYLRNGLPECCGIPDPVAVAAASVRASASAVTYRTPSVYPRASVNAVSLVRRDDPYRRLVNVSDNAVSLLLADDPHRRLANVSDNAVSLVTRDDPRMLAATYCDEKFKPYYWVVPDGVTSVTAHVVGGGGGGGRHGDSTVEFEIPQGGGGGGGQYLYGTFAVTPGELMYAWIGCGGAGGEGDTDGVDGEPTYFGRQTFPGIILIEAGGGKHGTATAGGAGGDGGSGGDGGTFGDVGGPVADSHGGKAYGPYGGAGGSAAIFDVSAGGDGWNWGGGGGGAGTTGPPVTAGRGFRGCIFLSW